VWAHLPPSGCAVWGGRIGGAAGQGAWI